MKNFVRNVYITIFSIVMLHSSAFCQVKLNTSSHKTGIWEGMISYIETNFNLIAITLFLAITGFIICLCIYNNNKTTNPNTLWMIVFSILGVYLFLMPLLVIGFSQSFSDGLKVGGVYFLFYILIFFTYTGVNMTSGKR